MKKFKVQLVKSTIGCTDSQVATIKALGLRGLQRSVVVVDNKANRGQIKKIQHLVKVEVQG
jgi:large subunit ribosomal protein L30